MPATADRTLRLRTWLLSASLLGLLAAFSAGSFLPVIADAQAATDSDMDDPEDLPPPSDLITFRIAFKTPLDISSYAPGEKIEARLQDDFKVGNKVLAPSGSLVIGHMEMWKKRRLSKAAASARLAGRGAIPVFDRIITSNHQELRIIGIAPEQNSVFSNGEEIRQILVGGHGELLRVDDGEVTELTDMGIGLPHAWTPGHPTRLKIEPGDQLTINATMPDGISVAGTIIKKSERD